MEGGWQGPMYDPIVILSRSKVGKILQKDPIREAKLAGSYIGSYQKGKLIESCIGSYHDPVESA